VALSVGLDVHPHPPLAELFAQLEEQSLQQVRQQSVQCKLVVAEQIAWRVPKAPKIAARRAAIHDTDG